jgi:hypothetical protein
MNDSDDEEDDSGNDSDDESWQVSFPELDAEIRRIISRYDGAVFPKLNWSSPQVSSLALTLKKHRLNSTTTLGRVLDDTRRSAEMSTSS